MQDRTILFGSVFRQIRIRIGFYKKILEITVTKKLFGKKLGTYLLKYCRKLDTTPPSSKLSKITIIPVGVRLDFNSMLHSQRVHFLDSFITIAKLLAKGIIKASYNRRGRAPGTGLSALSSRFGIIPRLSIPIVHLERVWLLTETRMRCV